MRALLDKVDVEPDQYWVEGRSSEDCFWTTEGYYMNPNTGSVDTLDGWGEDFDDSLIPVQLDENGDLVEVG